MKKTCFLVSLVMMFVSCNKTKELPKISLMDETNEKVETLVSAGELSTAEYTIEKIIKANDCSNWKIGDRKILFSCKAYLEGGVDMADYDASKTKIDETAKTIEMTLPKVKLLSFNMPIEEVKMKYEKVTGLRFKFSAKDRNKVLQQGEADIKNDIENIGIITDAKNNAQLFFTSMLKQMGYKQVIIKFE